MLLAITQDLKPAPAPVSSHHGGCAPQIAADETYASSAVHVGALIELQVACGCMAQATKEYKGIINNNIRFAVFRCMSPLIRTYYILLPACITYRSRFGGRIHVQITGAALIEVVRIEVLGLVIEPWARYFKAFVARGTPFPIPPV